MIAISAKRTVVHFGHKHVCRKHCKKVEKLYIDECDLLNKESQKVSCYNELLNKTPLHNLAEDELAKVAAHYLSLLETIKQLEGSNPFVPIKDSITLS